MTNVRFVTVEFFVKLINQEVASEPLFSGFLVYTAQKVVVPVSR